MEAVTERLVGSCHLLSCMLILVALVFILQAAQIAGNPATALGAFLLPAVYQEAQEDSS